MNLTSFNRRVPAVLALLAPLFLFLTGCYTDPNISSGRFEFPGEPPQYAGPVTASQPPAAPPTALGSDAARANIGDRITISFTDVPPNYFPPQMEVKVNSDGTIALPYNKTIQALGRTAPEIQRDTRSAYVPELFVNLTPIVKFEDRFFFVGGEVRHPQKQFHTGSEMTVLRAIETAGGYTDFAKKTKIEVRRSNGKTEWVNGEKARKNPALDLHVYPNDHITVHRKIW